MHNIYRITLLTLLMLMATSCLKQTETITPLVPVKTLAELQREAMMHQALKAAGNTELSKAALATLEANQTDPTLFYLNIKYKIEDFDLNEKFDLENGYEILGHSILRALAKIFLALTGPKNIELDSFEVEIPSLNLDPEIVKTVKIKRVHFAFNKKFDAKTGNKLSFAFVEKLSLSKIDPLKEAFSYKKTQNNCQYKCIDFTVADADFTDYIDADSGLFFKPSLTINTIPKVLQMHLDGQIDIQIGLKLPF